MKDLTAILVIYGIFLTIFCEQETPMFPLEDKNVIEFLALSFFKKLVKTVKPKYLSKEFLRVMRCHFVLSFSLILVVTSITCEMQR